MIHPPFIPFSCQSASLFSMILKFICLETGHILDIWVQWMTLGQLDSRVCSNIQSIRVRRGQHRAGRNKRKVSLEQGKGSIIHGAKNVLFIQGVKGRDCIWISSKASIWEMGRNHGRTVSRSYLPGLVIVKRSSCRCCCKRKHIVRALIWARAKFVHRNSGRTYKTYLDTILDTWC